MNLLRVEMRRALHRRLVRWMIAVALFFCGVAGTIAFFAEVDKARPDEHPAILTTWWNASTGEGAVLMGAMFLVIGAAICGASVAGAEWRAGTITTILTWSPSRWRLHLARTASAAILSFLIGFALLVAFMAACVPAMLTHGDTSGTDAAWWWDLFLVMLRTAGMGTLLAVLALQVATLGRNTGAALVALAAWALVVENLIRGLKPGLARYLIGENVATVVPWRPMEDVPFDSSAIGSLVTLLVYLAVVLAVATWTFQHRDVAAT